MSHPRVRPSFGASVNSRRFKASLIDIGLMQRLAHLLVDVELRHENLLAIYRGKLAEQFVAQALRVSQKGELYYWAREDGGKPAEVDYLTHCDGHACPIEVKSGEGARCAACINSWPPILNVRKGSCSTPLQWSLRAAAGVETSVRAALFRGRSHNARRRCCGYSIPSFLMR